MSVKCLFVSVRRWYSNGRIDCETEYVKPSARGTKEYEKISAIMKQIGDRKETKFEVKEDGSLYYKDMVCVPNDCELKKVILEDMLRSCVIDYEGS